MVTNAGIIKILATVILLAVVIACHCSGAQRAPTISFRIQTAGQSQETLETRVSLYIVLCKWLSPCNGLSSDRAAKRRLICKVGALALPIQTPASALQV